MDCFYIWLYYIRLLSEYISSILVLYLLIIRLIFNFTIISYVGSGFFDFLLGNKNRNRDNQGGGCPGEGCPGCRLYPERCVNASARARRVQEREAERESQSVPEGLDLSLAPSPRMPDITLPNFFGDVAGPSNYVGGSSNYSPNFNYSPQFPMNENIPNPHMNYDNYPTQTSTQAPEYPSQGEGGWAQLLETPPQQQGRGWDDQDFAPALGFAQFARPNRDMQNPAIQVGGLAQPDFDLSLGSGYQLSSERAEQHPPQPRRASTSSRPSVSQHQPQPPRASTSGRQSVSQQGRRRSVSGSGSGQSSSQRDDWRATESMPGGPIDPSLLFGYRGHVACKVWENPVCVPVIA